MKYNVIMGGLGFFNEKITGAHNEKSIRENPKKLRGIA
jgi:hypothetical protein